MSLKGMGKPAGRAKRGRACSLIGVHVRSCLPLTENGVLPCALMHAETLGHCPVIQKCVLRKR